MTVNLKTAKALDVAMPPSILLRADEVIEQKQARMHLPPLMVDFQNAARFRA